MHPEIIMFTEQRRGSLARMKNLVLTPKPVIEVTLTDDQKDTFVPQYTSLDEIKGKVSITTSCDTSFDDIYITFEGSTRTFVEKIATTSPTNGRTEAFHNFIRLSQPMNPSVFPNPRVFEAGKTYKYAFNFVVPDTLLPQSCTHAKTPGFPEGGHMVPPPSLGDPLVASMGKSLMDDMAPDMGTIGTLLCSILFLLRPLGCTSDMLWRHSKGFVPVRLLEFISRLASVSSRDFSPLGSAP